MVSAFRRAGARLAPQIVVIDHDDDPPEESEDPRWAHVPRVVIGSADMPEDWQPDQTGPAPQHYLQKPFDYGELVATVEHLLEAPAAVASTGPFKATPLKAA